MNTIRSFWLGWGAVCVAGAGAYYFAKQQVNADRLQKHQEFMRRKEEQRQMEFGSLAEGYNNGGPARTDSAGSPSQEVGHDPAPTRHAPETEGQRVTEKSKYESAQPYRPRRGDRFS